MKKLIVGNFDIAESILRGYWKDRENFMVNLGARWVRMLLFPYWMNCLEVELEDVDKETACFREIYQDVTKGKVNEDKLTFRKKWIVVFKYC
jgi:hypothetical protein